MSQLTEKTENATPNRLVSLKVLVFLFFGALQCMYAFLPYHMKYLGFNLSTVRIITLASALLSIIGPLLVGLILDNVSTKRPNAYGRCLRILLFIFFILAGVMFGSLLLLRSPATGLKSDAKVTFSCNDHGGHVFIRSNLTDGVCLNLEGRTGDLRLANCTYTCEVPENFKHLYESVDVNRGLPAKLTDDTANLYSSENPVSDYDYLELPAPEPLVQAPTSAPLIPPPHVCVTREVTNDNGTTNQTHCHVQLPELPEKVIVISDVVGKKANMENNQFGDEWCMHPLESFTCHIPERQVLWMHTLNRRNNENYTCSPAVECHIDKPSDKTSILRFEMKNKAVRYDLYVVLRVIAELFPVILHMLLNIAIIIATRETSVGRGNVGHQWVYYPFGVLFFASLIGLLNHAIVDVEPFFIPILVFSITCFVCAIIVLFSGKLPLTPSDWWWHTKCGMLAIPMSALKRYKWVIAAIAIVAFLLGGLWHVQVAFRHIFHIDIIEFAIIGESGNWRSKTFVYIIGALLAVPLIYNGEKIVDCLGHSNIFILAFVSFALRFGGLYFDNESSWTTLFEFFEPMSFYLPWLALILYTRHLIPKKFLAVGQGLLVILFFSLGRAIGFFYGTSIISVDKYNTVKWATPELNRAAEINDLADIHSVCAGIACLAAILYFVVYHLILAPRYRVPINRLAANNDTSVSPQRVFHDERSRKGYFRY